MKTCKNCHNFSWCLSLCKEVAAYVSQDEVNQKELLIGTPQYSPPFPFKPSPIYLTETQKKILTLSSQNVDRSQIRNLLGLSSVSLRQQIFQMSRKYYNEADFLL